jgi:hypothetical protein
LYGCGDGSTPPATATPSGPLPSDWFADLEERTFRFFWETTNADTGLALDRWPSASPCSIASVGFALTAYVIGHQRGWITRADAARRSRVTLEFLLQAPQGAQPSGVSGHHGFFYHFLDPRTGLRAQQSELSSVDTALFLMGALHARQAYDGTNDDEARLRRAADALYARADWRWFAGGGPGVRMAWDPAEGFSSANWNGYDEAMFVYLLALGSPTFPLGPEAWAEWTRTYETKSHWGSFYGQTHLNFAPLFGHQYTQCWVDLRGLQDAYMASKSLDYFENSRRATLAHRAYAIENPGGFTDYGADIWGLTACDGPGDFSHDAHGRTVQFRGYSSRGLPGAPWSWDDGTLAPTAAGASIAFAPEIVKPCLTALRQRYGDAVYRQYGFIDAFNPTVDFNARFAGGRYFTGLGWFDDDYIGIDQGPILAMFANHRDESVWRTMRGADWLQRGLRAAGFHGGWLG